jgi:hypothetical protein
MTEPVRDLIRALPVVLPILVASAVPRAFEPLMYGRAVVIGAVVAWRIRAEYPHRLGFLQRADCR